IRNYCRSFRKHRLFEVVICPREAASFEPGFEGLQHAIVQFHLSAKQLSYCFGGQIIRRGAEPAGSYYQIAKIACLSKRPDELLPIVAYFKNSNHLYADGKELISDHR